MLLSVALADDPGYYKDSTSTGASAIVTWSRTHPHFGDHIVVDFGTLTMQLQLLLAWFKPAFDGTYSKLAIYA